MVTDWVLIPEWAVVKDNWIVMEYKRVITFSHQNLGLKHDHC